MNIKDNKFNIIVENFYIKLYNIVIITPQSRWLLKGLKLYLVK
jgi:hypothetical protein